MNPFRRASAVLLSLLATSLAWSQPVPRAVPPAPPDEVAEPMAPPTPKSDTRITLELRDGSRLFGRPKAWKAFKLKTRFGEVAIEMKEVKGIRFSELDDVDAGSDVHRGNVPDEDLPNDDETSERGNITVHFNNGDIVSGELTTETMELEAAWGKSTVAVKEMSSIINSVNQCVWNWENGWRIRRLDEMQATYPRTYAPVPEPGPWHSHPTPPLVPVAPPLVPEEDHPKAPMPD